MNGKQNKLAEAAKAIRKEAGYTLAQVETQSGGEITNGYVSKIENGQAGDVTLEKLVALARGLKIPPQVLLDAVMEKAHEDSIHISRAVVLMRELNEGQQRTAVRMIEALAFSNVEPASPQQPVIESGAINVEGGGPLAADDLQGVSRLKARHRDKIEAHRTKLRRRKSAKKGGNGKK